MSFTTEDLKRLKEKGLGNDPIKAHETFQALLARLEAAEAVVHEVKVYVAKITPPMYRSRELIEIWEKSCGKDGV